MRIYDSSSHTKVEFVPIHDGEVCMYVCGPTVYDDIHIGNARTFLSFDIVRRWLIEKGYKVTFAQNLTDVDDKIINRAQERSVDASEIAQRYADEFIRIQREFGILDPDIRPRATQEITPMLDMIQGLIDAGHAYVAQGDVYFSVRSDPHYGHVSNRDVDELKSGARIESGEIKRDPLDFALWKAAKPGEPTWDSPWGLGRPGWHTECAAMVHRYLGTPIDIHGGGGDLAFPHHENESAQAECCWGGVFANTWMHAGMLRVNGEKMSKSLGNFYTLREVLDSNSAMALRLLMLQTHYRSPLDFSFERLEGAQSAYERVCNVLINLDWASDKATSHDTTLKDKAEQAKQVFTTCMDDDFNTAGALASIFELVNEANSHVDALNASVDSYQQAAHVIRWALGVLGITEPTREELPQELIELAQSFSGYEGSDTNEAAQELMRVRAEARAAKDWTTADAIRDAIANLGLMVEDTAEGARVRRSSKRSGNA